MYLISAHHAPKRTGIFVIAFVFVAFCLFGHEIHDFYALPVSFNLTAPPHADAVRMDLC